MSCMKDPRKIKLIWWLPEGESEVGQPHHPDFVVTRIQRYEECGALWFAIYRGEESEPRERVTGVAGVAYYEE